MNSEHKKKGIPFAFLCSLFREIANIKSKTIKNPRKLNVWDDSYPALKVFKLWVTELRKNYVMEPGTTAICFRLLFPEEDTKRKYDIQEFKLAKCLENCLALSPKSLTHWDAVDATGCLGLELQRLLDYKSSDGQQGQSSLTINQVDELLSELASLSRFTHITTRNKYPKPRRSRENIIKLLFRPLPPIEAAFLVHIILKDLRPMLYPSPDAHYSKALLDYNTKAVIMLVKEHAMKAWDVTNYMLNFYRLNNCIDDAAAAYELPASRRPKLKPSIGTMIQLPKSQKGTSCEHALSCFHNSKRVWAETKYDGERAQIHVQITDGGSEITIFSKSKRDSTLDRIAVHDIISEALSLDGPSRATRPKKNIVLDGEMVAWCDDHIDEFYRINSLVGETARGARSKLKSKKDQETNGDSDPTERHLGLVFFDILVIDDVPVLFDNYESRRRKLESYIKPIPSKAILSQRYMVDMSSPNPVASLQAIFAEHVTGNEEGLVIKADDSFYQDLRLPWVKLKKDYIPGFGDCVDLVVVAAGWERDRARELRVTPNVFTTLYVGVITNSNNIKLKPNTKPHILAYFTVSYGLDRRELEKLNFQIRSDEIVAYSPTTQKYNMASFDIEFSPLLEHKPTVILENPIMVEILGAGFTKRLAGTNMHYELRFPRITKIHNRLERPWTECMDISELNKIAWECIGKDRPDKDIADWGNTLWGQLSSPSIATKRQDRAQEVKAKLMKLERSYDDQVEGEEEVPTSPGKRRKLDPSSNKQQKLSSPSKNHEVTSRRATKYKIPSPSERVVTKQTPGALQPVTLNTPTPSPVKNDDGDSDVVSCFINTPGCHHCSKWKKNFSKTRRLHSLDAFLTACSQSGSGSSGTNWWMNVKKGLIFIDSRDSTMIQSVLDTIEAKVKAVDSNKVQIIVFRCDVSRLTESNALLVL